MLKTNLTFKCKKAKAIKLWLSKLIKPSISVILELAITNELMFLV
jgi:hypothetical protein